MSPSLKSKIWVGDTPTLQKNSFNLRAQLCVLAILKFENKKI
jgi:hypothetical protein